MLIFDLSPKPQKTVFAPVPLVTASTKNRPTCDGFITVKKALKNIKDKLMSYGGIAKEDHTTDR